MPIITLQQALIVFAACVAVGVTMLVVMVFRANARADRATAAADKYASAARHLRHTLDDWQAQRRAELGVPPIGYPGGARGPGSSYATGGYIGQGPGEGVRIAVVGELGPEALRRGPRPPAAANPDDSSTLTRPLPVYTGDRRLPPMTGRDR